VTGGKPLWHWWLLALGKTLRAVLDYEAKTREAVGGEVVVTADKPKQEKNDGA
jgi:hypothetical protein